VSPCYSCKFRTKLRYRYKLDAVCCGDCCAHFFCNRCAIVQDYVQLRAELRRG
jgi:Cys-rich protein (TIGR01571 family)